MTFLTNSQLNCRKRLNKKQPNQAKSESGLIFYISTRIFVQLYYGSLDRPPTSDCPVKEPYISFILFIRFFCFCRKARQEAIHKTHPEFADHASSCKLQLKYPRPMSEPPSPSQSRTSTPAPSEPGSEDHSSDEERE